MKTGIKIANLLFVLAFLAFLATVGVTSVTRPQQTDSVYENRVLASYPTPTVENLATGRYFTKLETALCDHSAYRNAFLRLKTGMDLTLGRPVVNTVIPTDQGVYLPYQEYQKVDEEVVARRAQEITDDLAALQARVQAYGGTFLYVAVPDQGTYYAPLYPSYLNDGTQRIRAEKEAFLAQAAQKGIPVLDIDALWAAQGFPDGYVYKEDHHWTFEGGYAAYGEILNALGMEQTVEFTVQEWQAPMIGSRVVRLCDLMQPLERLRYATPKEWIPFTRYNWGNRTPAYENTIALPLEGDPIRYGNYMGGDVDETIIQTNRPQLTDCLVVGDSFTNLVETLIYTEFDETRSLDFRYYNKMSMSQYIDRYQPQVVLVLRDVGSLLDNTGNGNLK